MSTKRYGPPRAGEIIAGIFRSRGLPFNLERLQDRADAEKSRAKVNSTAAVERVRDLAIAARKARRTCELAEMTWRMNPNVDTLAEARSAQQVRSAADAEFREACLHDESLISDIQRQVGR